MTPLEIAIHHLLAAISAFDGGDFLTAINSAGAAEEILGGMLKEGGELNTYTAIKSILDQTLEQLDRSKHTTQEFNEIANGVRNSIKHFNASGVSKDQLKQEAVNLIHRAVSNFHTVNGQLSNEMLEWVKALDMHPRYPIKDA